MNIEEARQLKKGQTVYFPATVRGVENNGNEISISVCYAGRFGRTTSDIRAYYEQLVLPLTHREIQLILNALDGYVIDCPATHELIEKLEAYRKGTEMTKDEIMNKPIGSPILMKAWFADATETHALVRVTDEHGKARECWVKHSHVVQPKPEWFRKEQDNE